jgi:tetratricopeptide (TPR) repeat protein
MGSEDPKDRTSLALEAADRAERLSTQALAVRFVGREHEVETALEHLLSGDDSEDGRTLVVHGDSGTGKTFLARELMRRAYEVRPHALYLYSDVANDEYQSTRTIGSLLKTSLVAGRMTGASIISVPEELSLDRYRRRTRRRGAGRGFIRAIAAAIGGAIGLGTAVGAALDKSSPAGAAPVEDELAAYFSWAARRELVLLVLDNVQFLNLDVRLTIESVLQRVGKNIRLIALDRTVDDASQLAPPIRCFADGLLELRVGHLTRSETEQLVAGAVGRDVGVDSLAEDIFTKTNGLAKDVEYCLRQYSLELGRGARVGAIDGLLSTIDRLPLIHRQFLVIAAFLDGGVNKGIARGTVRRLAAVYDNTRLDAVVDELVARDYLRLTGEAHDRLRPGHERIVTAIRDLADEDLHEEVRHSLIEELTAALEAPDAGENEAYLLHCLVGLQTARELTRNLHYISRLIQSQHRQDQFSYLVAISDELQEVLALLPEHVLDDLLDAMQKSSAFDRGLQVVRLLDSKDVPGSATRKIYRLKYLTQAYRYDEALELSEELGQDEWGAVYRLNALMALDRVDEARALADAHLSDTLSECQAVLRRNAVTLYDVSAALSHLDRAYEYFEREHSDYRLATVDTNRGLVYLNAGGLGDALRSLETALERMRYVGSREVYQAQVNLAVRSALLGDHASALDALGAAAVHVPRALLLDQVKISMNRAVIECAAGMTDSADCERSLVSSSRRTRGVQTPYLDRALAANLAVARGERPTEPVAHPERVSLTAELPADGRFRSGAMWSLMMSVHWRY